MFHRLIASIRAINITRNSKHHWVFWIGTILIVVGIAALLLTAPTQAQALKKGGSIQQLQEGIGRNHYLFGGKEKSSYPPLLIEPFEKL